MKNHNFQYIKNVQDKIFALCIVHENKTITEASNKYSLDDATISNQIYSLEKDLQISLFAREKNRLKITKQGKKYYKKAKYILSLIDNFYKINNKQNIPFPSLHHYKKNKIHQIEGFCTVVEFGSIANASANGFRKDILSMQVKSLEYDLQTFLFERKNNKLIINKYGKKYYRIARFILNELFAFYKLRSKIRPVKNLFLMQTKMHLKYFFEDVIKVIRKTIVKVSLKKVIIVAIGLFLGVLCAIWVYLYNTNYFFDRKIYKLANPLLKQVIEDGYYNIPHSQICPAEEQDLAWEMYDIYEKLFSLYGHNFHFTIFATGGKPLIISRMSGDQEVDRAFYNKDIISCNLDSNYNGVVKYYNKIKDFFKNNNFIFYDIYYESDCLHFEQAIKNKAKYQNFKIIKGIKSTGDDVRAWVVNYNKYYYLLSIVNIHANAEDEHLQKERHIIFKKLTLDQLMQYDNGSYWKLIKDYNIKID